MYYELYIDVLFLENFMMDSLLLLAVNKMLKNSATYGRLFIGAALGLSLIHIYFEKFGLLGLTNVDLPGEAGTIMHRKEDIGTVELATMTFGQSFQITPIQMATTVSSLINGGTRVTPHLGVAVLELSLIHI